MGTDEARVPAMDEPSEAGRRWMLGLAGAGGLAAVLAAARPAAAGHDDTNVLHIGAANSSPPGAQTGLFGDHASAVLNVANANTSDPAMAIFASTDGLKSIVSENHFMSEDFHGVGIEGVHSSIDGYGRGLGVGVVGVSAGTAVVGASQGELGFGTGAGVGVYGQSGTGTGVLASSQSGLALEVQGRAGFSTAGNGTIAKSARSATVAAESVNASSHVSVTLTSDPRGALLEWVERQAGTGFVVHLNAPAKRDTTFSYLVVEPV